MIQAVQCWIYVHSVLLHVLGSFDTNSLTHIYCDALHSRIKNVAACHWMCTFFAVILNRFTTLKGKRICAGPGKVWTKTSMAYLDGKNWQIQRANSHHHWHNIHLHTKRQESEMKSSQLIVCYLSSTDWMFFSANSWPHFCDVTWYHYTVMYSFNYIVFIWYSDWL